MTTQALSNVFWLGIYVAYIVWAVLLILMVQQLVKRNHGAFKITLLCAINSLVFLIAWGIILKLALIVLGPKDAAVLRQQANDHFMDLLRSSAFILLGLTVVNILYLKFITKVSPYRVASILIAVDAAILFSASYLSAEYYYLGLLPDTQ